MLSPFRVLGAGNMGCAANGATRAAGGLPRTFPVSQTRLDSVERCGGSEGVSRAGVRAKGFPLFDNSKSASTRRTTGRTDPPVPPGAASRVRVRLSQW